MQISRIHEVALGQKATRVLETAWVLEVTQSHTSPRIDVGPQSHTSPQSHASIRSHMGSGSHTSFESHDATEKRELARLKLQQLHKLQEA
jgi:hypothetical protein